MHRLTVIDWSGFQTLYSRWSDEYGASDTIIVQILAGPNTKGEFEIGVDLNDDQFTALKNFLREQRFKFGTVALRPHQMPSKNTKQ